MAFGASTANTEIFYIYFPKLSKLQFLRYDILFLKKILFIYLTERERSQAGREAGGRRGGSRLPAEQRAQPGAQSQDLEIMTWAEGRGLTHWATQAPLLFFSLLHILQTQTKLRSLNALPFLFLPVQGPFCRFSSPVT